MTKQDRRYPDSPEKTVRLERVETPLVKLCAAVVGAAVPTASVHPPVDG